MTCKQEKKKKTCDDEESDQGDFFTSQEITGWVANHQKLG